MGARILVADDSVTIQKVVELTFSKEDFVLVQARTGEEAIRKAKEARPDLVLLDLMMPDKNGYEVCAALRAEPALRAVPIILLPGTFEAFDKEQGLRAGADDFVTKPFESQVLIGKVKQLLFARMLEKGTLGPASSGPMANSLSTPPAASHEVAPPTAPAEASPSVGGSKGKAEGEGASQDVLWQLLDAPGPPADAAGPELTLEALTGPPGPPGAGEVQTDIPLLELDAVGPGAGDGQTASAGRAAEAACALPESLSLEELLETPSPPPPTDVAPLVEEDSGAPPVFELPEHLEAPPLPMHEVVEEPAAPVGPREVSGTSAMAGAEAAAPAPSAEAAPVVSWGAVPEEPPLPDAIQGAAPPVGVTEAPGASVEVSLTPEEMAVIEAGEAGHVATVTAPAEPSLEMEQFPLWAAGPTAPPIADSAPEAPPAEAQSLPAPPAPAGPAEADLATMRDAVTERVAHELARDLTEKLVERIERIVWEVVPDLAEILITKEIERIRAMAQGKKSS